MILIKHYADPYQGDHSHFHGRLHYTHACVERSGENRESVRARKMETHARFDGDNASRGPFTYAYSFDKEGRDVGTFRQLGKISIEPLSREKKGEKRRDNALSARF